MEECCAICGSVGVPDALVTCSQCKASLQHMYCMRARFLEYPDDWCCEECEPSSKPTFSRLANCSEVRKGAVQPSKIGKLLNESKRGPFNWEKKVATSKTEYISINDVIKLPSEAIDFSSRSKVTCQSSTSQPPTKEEKSCFSRKNSAFEVRWTSLPGHSRFTPCASPTQVEVQRPIKRPCQAHAKKHIQEQPAEPILPQRKVKSMMKKDATASSPGLPRVITASDMTDNAQEHFEDPAEGVDPRDPQELIYVVSGKLQPNSHKISAFITSQIKLNICEEGHCWKYVTPVQRQWYWDQFVATYKWSPLFDSKVKKAWSSTIATQYRRTVHAWRDSDRKPKCLASDVWAAWKKVWASGEWLKRSVIYKENRHSEPAGLGTGMTKHTAGSRSFVDHNYSMRAKLGREPNSYELFYKTHTNKADEFVDERSRSFSAAFEAQREILSSTSGAGSSQPVPLTGSEINQLYLNVAGGVQKGGKVYGLGTQASGIYPEATAQRGAPSGSRSIAVATKAVMEAARNEVWMYRDENAQLRERVGLLEETVRNLVASLGPDKKTSASSIALSSKLPSSSSGPAPVEKFTHVSDTYDDENFPLHDQDGDDDDETQTP